MHTSTRLGCPACERVSLTRAMSNVEIAEDEASANMAMISNEEYKSMFECALLTDASLEKELAVSIRHGDHACAGMANSHDPVDA